MVRKLFINSIAILSICQIVFSSLDVQPFMMAVNPGDSVKFTCIESENSTTTYLSWKVTNKSQNSVIEIPISGRIRAVNGTLSIDNVTYDDANTYTCEHGGISNTGILKVYDLPNYIKEGIIIASICFVLLIALLVMTCLSMARQKQQRKQRLMGACPQKKHDHKLLLN